MKTSGRKKLFQRLEGGPSSENKGDLADFSDYRGITMLSVLGKIFNRIILQRLSAALETVVRDQQMGFRRNRTYTDHIAALRIIVEQSLEWNPPLYVTFVDSEKLSTVWTTLHSGRSYTTAVYPRNLLPSSMHRTTILRSESSMRESSQTHLQ